MSQDSAPLNDGAPFPADESYEQLRTQGKRYLRKRRVKSALSWVAVILVAMGTVLFVLGTYRSNSGEAVYPGTDRHPDVRVSFSCGSVTPTNPFYGNGVAVFHGQPLTMRGVHNLGPMRPQLSTNVSTFDMENAATSAKSDVVASITQKALSSTCMTYGEHVIMWVEFEAGALFLVGLMIWWRERNRFVARGAVYLFLVNVIVVVSFSQAYGGAMGLKDVRSPADIFSYNAVRTDPAAIGPINAEPRIAVGPDSRMSGWRNGRLVPNPTQADIVCHRTVGNVASWLGVLNQVSVLDTSCPGADMISGILTPEVRHGIVLPTQMGLIKSAPNLQYIVLDPGPNGAGWGLIIGSAVHSAANIAPIPIAVDATIDKMRPIMDDLIAQLRQLHRTQPGHPRVILVGTYQLFRVGMHCAATDGITDQEMAMINNAGDSLNQYLASVAAQNKDFVSFVAPHLVPLCVTNSAGGGPTLVGDPHSPYYMHPTALGDELLASQINADIHIDLSRPLKGTYAPSDPASSQQALPRSSPSR